MDCVQPIIAWKCGTALCKSDGQISPHLVFSHHDALEWYCSRFGGEGLVMLSRNEVALPCGKCPNCLARKRRLQSVKLIHEKSLYENACFITLTYDEEQVPCTDKLPNDDSRKRFSRGNSLPVKTLYPNDVTKFLKRLRRHLEYCCKKKKDHRDHVEKIRYFCVGEYGGKTGRPHYHIIVFNWFPGDAKFFRGHDYISSQISKLWPYGFHLVSRVVDASCRYCAQYVTKKLVKRSSSLDVCRVPEHVRQSTHNGGIGIPWFIKYHDHVGAVGYCTYRSNGVVYRSGLPKSYVRAFRKFFPDKWLVWRDKFVHSAKNLVALSREEILARSVLNMDLFRKTLERGVL